MTSKRTPSHTPSTLPPLMPTVRRRQPTQTPARAAAALLALAAACGLAGCASSLPFHYYTLLDTTPAVDATTTAGTTAKPVLIAVQSPTLPTQVTRPQLVLSEPGGQISIREQERWSQPLAAEIQQALSQDLTRALPAIDVARTVHADSQPVYRVGLDVQRFETTTHGGVTLDVVWSVAGAPDGTPMVCRDVQHQTTAQPAGIDTARSTPATDYVALVDAQRHALQRVAQHVAAAIRAEQDGQTASCP